MGTGHVVGKSRKHDLVRLGAWRAFCLVALVLALLVSGVNARGSSRGVDYAAIRAACSPLALGVHIDLAYEASAARRASVVAATRDVLKARIARNTLLWDRIETDRGERDWSVADAVVDELTRARIEPLLVVMGSPSWANGVPSSVDMHQLYVPTKNEAFATWLKEFASFAHDAALRYRGKVHRWEVWNEPNLRAFWPPKPDIGQYSRTYVAVRAAILAADPGARVAVGGLSALAVAWGNVDIPGLAFLRGLIAGGVRPTFVAIHPYTIPSHAPNSNLKGQNNFDDIALVHSLLVELGVRSPIWVTEWGWSSRGIGLDRQATYVARSLAMLRGQYPYVTVATYFIDHDRPPTFYQGLLDSALRPKPAATRFAAFAASLEECRMNRQSSTA